VHQVGLSLHQYIPLSEFKFHIGFIPFLLTDITVIHEIILLITMTVSTVILYSS